MAVDYQVGGVPHNAFDIDADGEYLYLAVLNSSNQPQILKMSAALDADAIASYNPGSGSEVNLMAGDMYSYWIWAAGNFGGTDRVAWTGDGGVYWYIQDDGTLTGTARPVLVGPGDDSLLTTAGGLVLYQNRYEGDIQYWIDRAIPGEIWALDRVDVNFEQLITGAYWYTGDSSVLVNYSPNSGLQWNDVTDSLPDATVTSLVIGQ